MLCGLTPFSTLNYAKIKKQIKIFEVKLNLITFIKKNKSLIFNKFSFPENVEVSFHLKELIRKMLTVKKTNRPDIKKIIHSEWFTEKSLVTNINLQNHNNLMSMEISFSEQGEKEQNQKLKKNFTQVFNELNPILKTKNENVSESSSPMMKSIAKTKSIKFEEIENIDEDENDEDKNSNEAKNQENSSPKKKHNKFLLLKARSFKKPNNNNENKEKNEINKDKNITKNETDSKTLQKSKFSSEPNPEICKENELERDTKKITDIQITENKEDERKTSKINQNIDEKISNKKINRPKTILKMRSLLVEENETFKTDEPINKIIASNQITLHFPNMNELKRASQENQFETKEEKNINDAKIEDNLERSSNNFPQTNLNERKLSSVDTNSNLSSQQTPFNNKEGKLSKKVLKFADELVIKNERELNASVRIEKKFENTKNQRESMNNNLFDIYHIETSKEEDLQKELERESLEFFARLSEKFKLLEEQENNKGDQDEAELILENDTNNANNEEKQHEITHIKQEKKEKRKEGKLESKRDSDLNTRARISESKLNEKADKKSLEQTISGHKDENINDDQKKEEQENKKQTSHSKKISFDNRRRASKIKQIEENNIIKGKEIEHQSSNRILF